MFGLNLYMYVYDWHGELLYEIVYLVKITWIWHDWGIRVHVGIGDE